MTTDDMSDEHAEWLLKVAHGMEPDSVLGYEIKAYVGRLKDRLAALETHCMDLICDQVMQCRVCKATGYPKPDHTAECSFETREETQ